MSWPLRFSRPKPQYLPLVYSPNFHALDAAAFTAEDSNSRLRRFQKLRQVLAKRRIRAIFQGRRLQPYFQSAIDNSGNFVAAGARLHADLKDDSSAARHHLQFLTTGIIFQFVNSAAHQARPYCTGPVIFTPSAWAARRGQ